MENSISILNARIVNEGTIVTGDVIVENGRIASVGSSTPSQRKGKVIDACGAWLIPGLIDDQVHFREPGFPEKACIRNESMAAVAGGVTSYMEMPNTRPPTIDQARWQEKMDIAARDSHAHFGFYLGATNDNLEEIRRSDPKRIPGIKVFMGSSTGNMRVSDPDILEAVFKASPTLVATHCEDDDIIARNMVEFEQRYGADIPPGCHPEIRSREACLASSKLAVELARRHNTRLHVLHITTREELELFGTGPLDSKSITCEACVHHLLFNDDAYGTLGHRLKCNPAVKKETDRQALLQAIRENRIDVIATDHAPHTVLEKNQPYKSAPSGLPLVQHSLPILLDLVAQGSLDIQTVVSKSSHSVAELFGIPHRGFIREGYWADLVLCQIHPKGEGYSDPVLLSRCGWSPFEHRPLRGKVMSTFVDGQLVWDGHRICGKPDVQPLQFAR